VTPAAGYLLAVLLGAGALAGGVAGLLGWPWALALPALVPLGGLELTLDPLAGFFLILVGGATIPAAIYAMGDAHGARGQGLAFNAFVVSMAVVPLAANVVTFLLAWELMALASYFLVIERALPAGHEEAAGLAAREAAHAGWVYALMTHAGLACLLAGMLLVAAATGSLRFADWRAAAGTLPEGLRLGAFVLLALGFAGKAGVMPLHVWLPLAHPAAPSHVSALMSGVMVKLGLYGLIRAAFEWLAPGPVGWGAVLLLAGAVSALAGILYALVDRDLKRVLAFSTIENVGVILVAIGGALAFRAAGLPVLAVLSLAAGLYHALNHAAFKALLFLGAGALVHGAGTRDLDEMGGLIKRMPWTAACFLLGSLAIAAMPPLNGFVSEWLIFQALLQNVAIPVAGLNLAFTAGLASLALTAGLTVACFVRASGTALLALPRGAGAAVAREVTWPARGAMLGLVAACVALGVGPTFVLPALARAAAGLVGVPPPELGDWFTLRIPDDFARLSALAVALALAVGIAVPAVFLRWLGRGRRIGETWGCGRLLQTARMEYTATAFSNPFTRVFDFLYRPRQVIDIETHPESRFFVRAIRYRHETRSVVEDHLYHPLGRLLRALTARIQVLQSGSTNVYLAYILIALLVLLVLA
jgi:formate hydrogenlyase subunit 3/multisubunit Na+/H+ antiporter MnhD subunit